MKWEVMFWCQVQLLFDLESLLSFPESIHNTYLYLICSILTVAAICFPDPHGMISCQFVRSSKHLPNDFFTCILIWTKWMHKLVYHIVICEFWVVSSDLEIILVMILSWYLLGILKWTGVASLILWSLSSLNCCPALLVCHNYFLNWTEDDRGVWSMLMASYPEFWCAPLWVFVRSPIAGCTRYVAHLSTWMWESRSFVCEYLHTDKGVSTRRSLLFSNNWLSYSPGTVMIDILQDYRIGHWKRPFSRKHTRSQPYDSCLPIWSGSQEVLYTKLQWNWQTLPFFKRPWRHMKTITRWLQMLVPLFRWGGMLGAGLFCPGECPGSLQHPFVTFGFSIDRCEGYLWHEAKCANQLQP